MFDNELSSETIYLVTIIQLHFLTYKYRNYCREMAREPDEELRKAFSQLHEKMIDTTQKLKLADLQIDKLKRSKQFAELTMKEITSYSKNTKTYESVGRMFLLDEMDSIKAGLEKRMKNADDKVKTLENNKTYLQQNLKECENNIREMIQQRQNKDTSG